MNSKWKTMALSLPKMKEDLCWQMVTLTRCFTFYWVSQHWNNSFCSLVPILVVVVNISYIIYLLSLYFHHASDVLQMLYFQFKSVCNINSNLQLVFVPLLSLLCYSAFSRPLLSSGTYTLNPSTKYHCFKWIGLILSLF